MHLPGSRRFFEPQCATGHRHNDIVVGVDVVSGIGTRREAPLSNRYTLIFDLYFGRRFHNTHSPPRRVRMQPRSRSASVVAHDDTLMRIAVWPCQTVPPHQQVPSSCTRAITSSVRSELPNDTKTWLSTTSLSTR